jgi:hypothetical protein
MQNNEFITCRSAIDFSIITYAPPTKFELRPLASTGECVNFPCQLASRIRIPFSLSCCLLAVVSSRPPPAQPILFPISSGHANINTRGVMR